MLKNKLALPFFLLISTGLLNAQTRQLVFRAPSRTVQPRTGQRERTLKRSRAVEMDTRLFEGAAARLANREVLRTEMNFFDDVPLSVVWNDARPSDDRRSTVLTGSVEGMQYGHAVMVLSGRMAAINVATGDGRMFQLRTTDDGVQWARELDPLAFPDEAPSLRTSASPSEEMKAEVAHGQSGAAALPA